MTEGRKAHKDLGRNRDQKLSNQLGKIKNILEKDVSASLCFRDNLPIITILWKDNGLAQMLSSSWAGVSLLLLGMMLCIQQPFPSWQ